MVAKASIGIADDLSPGQAGIPLRASNDKAAGGIDKNLSLAVKEIASQDGINDRILHLVPDLFSRHLRPVLGGDDNRVNVDRPVTLIADGHL